MRTLIEPRSFWKNRGMEMKLSDPYGFALDVGSGMLVCLLPVGSVDVKMMQSQRHALEKTKGSDPVELSPPEYANRAERVWSERLGVGGSLDGGYDGAEGDL